MSLGTVFERRNVFAGTTVEGHRVMVNGEVHTLEGEHTTIDHTPIKDPFCLSLTVTVYRGRASNEHTIIAAGAAMEYVGKIVVPAPGFTSDEVGELYRLGKAYHLNTMRAGCAHMSIPDGKTAAELLDMGLTCEATGYQWGYSWLVEPLPADAHSRFMALMSQGRDPRDD